MWEALDFAERPLALGAMRLSTVEERDEEQAVAVLQAAFDAGVTLVDTADAYAHDHREVGHNERLIARALREWSGDRSRVRIATKGGLTRPDGLWVPNGRARHLAAACAASRQALGVERIHLYQLHARDPRTCFRTSLRALAALQRDGLVEHVGLANVNVAEIEEARGIVEVAAVQVELSLWNPDHVRSGVAAYCTRNAIPLFAHRPLGGPGRRRRTLDDRLLVELAAAHRATPFDIALAWLLDLSPAIVPLPGVTRVETARALGRARDIRFRDDDRRRLDERCPAGRFFRNPEARPRPARSAGEVVLIMGLPGAGKSTLAQDFVARGYARLNRDEAGGRLAGLLPSLDRRLRAGETRVVLDNTYVSRASRAEVVERAAAHGLPVRCVFARTPLPDVQINAVERMVRRHGRLLEPEEMKGRTDDPGAFGPSVPFRYERRLEPPAADEGFSAIEEAPFERRRDSSYANRAVLVWADGALYRGRSGRRRPLDPGDVDILPSRREVLAHYREAGYSLHGLAWRPEVGDGTARSTDVDAFFGRVQSALEVAIEFLYCPHGAGPPVCWCRKPLPGLPVLLIERHRLDVTACVYVGEGASERSFAARIGLPYREASAFFGRARSS